MKIFAPHGRGEPSYRADDPWEPWVFRCDGCGRRVSEYDFPIGADEHVCDACLDSQTEREWAEEMRALDIAERVRGLR